MEIKQINANEVPEKILMKAKNLRKTDKMIKKLDDKDVDSVAGGFWQKNGYAAGSWIECPICGRNTKYGITSWENDEFETTCFYCEECESIWAIDEYGYEWDIAMGSLY